MGWRVAGGLITLFDQLNKQFPDRSRISDGSIGDPSHSSRESDHNPDGSGVVRAIDITHDPQGGVDCNDLARALVASRDPRIKYIIWNRRIISSETSPWTWRPYAGVNPHDHHLHLSAVADARADSLHPWDIGSKDWFDSVSVIKLKELVRGEIREGTRDILDAIAEHRRMLATGGRPYNPEKVNIEGLLD